MDQQLDTAPCGFLSFTDNGEIVTVNATLLETLGYERGELEGRHVESILPVASRIFYQTHFFPLLRMQGKAEEIYLQLRTKGGADVPMLVSAIRRIDGELPVCDCILMPMRQRNQYEDEILQAKKTAEEATRAKDEFLAVVSHELRTPLTAILGWARLMRSGTLDDDIMETALETIERNAESQSQLIEDLLDFSRIISGKIRLDVASVDLSSLVDAAINVVRPAADAKGIRIQSILDPRAGPVSGDSERLQQVLWNLLSNAIKFTPKGGRVQIRLARVNSSVEIGISDTGEGISPEFLPYVFERFRQADNSMTRSHGGLGLGLAITRHIVELHGGTIRAISPGAGEGSTFVVKLPIMIVHIPEPSAKPPSAPEHAAGEHSRIEHLRIDGVRVLVVDDEKDTRELLVMILKQSGANVTACASVAGALERLKIEAFDLLISDIEMPGQDGYTLIRSVREMEKQGTGALPAIALTAHARATDRMQALAAGFQLHMTKPVEPAELVLAIASLSGRRRERSEEREGRRE